MSVVRVEQAHKSFGATAALRGASLELRPGELLGLLGPNGAGKTTLVRAIAGRVQLDRGSIDILGRPGARGAHPDLGVVPQEIALYPRLTARENLAAFARLHGVARADLAARVDRALTWTGLADRAREPVSGFSGGMKRRLNIACSVLHQPRVVLLDEPTAGVDPQSRERLHEMLAELRAGGASLLLTTHLLDEAESRCDRIVILDHGQVIAEGTVAALIDKTIGRGRSVFLTLDRPLAAPIPGFTTGPGGAEVSAQLQDVAAELPELLTRVRSAGHTVLDVALRGPSLHAVFLHLTGRELRE